MFFFSDAYVIWFPVVPYLLFLFPQPLRSFFSLLRHARPPSSCLRPPLSRFFVQGIFLGDDVLPSNSRSRSFIQAPEHVMKRLLFFRWLSLFSCCKCPGSIYCFLSVAKFIIATQPTVRPQIQGHPAPCRPYQPFFSLCLIITPFFFLPIPASSRVAFFLFFSIFHHMRKI